MALASFQVAALPFTGVDARSISMGGTGVAAGSIVNASTYNPALLAAYRDGEDFNFSVALGIIARDEDDMLDKAWGLDPDSRLSCQAVVADTDLVVELPKYTINMVSENH